MIHLRIDDHVQRRLPFYLAMEEWAAANLPADDYFFCWQVEPTVIFGRNQRIELEVNLQYCRDNNIATYRRKSGGGCVFADSHNIMFSYITTSEHVTTTFSRYTAMIASMLQSLGLDAEATGRNDITIAGRKVSGNSFYHVPGRSIVHGTMLYDTDFRHMANAITPSRSKLESKMVKSVPAHITTLSQHTDLSIDEFRQYAISHLTTDERTLTQSEIDEIERLSQPYYSPEWIFGRHSATALRNNCRIEGVGEFSTGIELKNGRIDHIDLEGDFFVLADLNSALIDRLQGVRYDEKDISEALRGIDVSQIVAGLSTPQFISLILNNFNDISWTKI